MTDETCTCKLFGKFQKISKLKLELYALAFSKTTSFTPTRFNVKGEGHSRKLVFIVNAYKILAVRLPTHQSFSQNSTSLPPFLTVLSRQAAFS